MNFFIDAFFSLDGYGNVKKSHTSKILCRVFMDRFSKIMESSEKEAETRFKQRFGCVGQELLHALS